MSVVPQYKIQMGRFIKASPFRLKQVATIFQKEWALQVTLYLLFSIYCSNGLYG